MNGRDSKLDLLNCCAVVAERNWHKIPTRLMYSAWPQKCCVRTIPYAAVQWLQVSKASSAANPQESVELPYVGVL
jgi:hypothetical protein